MRIKRFRINLGGATIQYPFRISGVDNIECGESVNIGKGSVIMCLRAKLMTD